LPLSNVHRASKGPDSTNPSFHATTYQDDNLYQSHLQLKMASEDLHPSESISQDVIPDEDDHTSASVGNEVPSITNSGPEIDVRVRQNDSNHSQRTNLDYRAIVTGIPQLGE
jgi:hypothetical protein